MPEATPFGVGPELVIRDNDGKFGADFDRAAKGAGIRVRRTAVQAPLTNSVCEWSAACGASVSTTLLFSANGTSAGCSRSFRYFNAARPHQGIGQRVPTARVLKGRTDPAGVIAVPVLGGLHHDYRAAARPRGWAW